MSRRSSTSTSRPALARYAAHASPLWPPPITTTSRSNALTTGGGYCPAIRHANLGGEPGLAGLASCRRGSHPTASHPERRGGGSDRGGHAVRLRGRSPGGEPTPGHAAGDGLALPDLRGDLGRAPEHRSGRAGQPAPGGGGGTRRGDVGGRWLRPARGAHVHPRRAVGRATLGGDRDAERRRRERAERGRRGGARGYLGRGTGFER